MCVPCGYNMADCCQNPTWENEERWTLPALGAERRDVAAAHAVSLHTPSLLGKECPCVSHRPNTSPGQ